MVDLGGPRIPGWTSPGTLTGGAGSREATSLQVGARIEVRVLDVLPDRSVRLRLGPSANTAGANTAGTAGAAARPTASPALVTAQLAGALPDALVNRPAGGSGPPVMLAEITRTEPRLEVRLLPLTLDRAGPRPAGLGPSASPAQQWLGQELRQHLPGARPLGPTLQALLPPAGGAPRGEAPTQATGAAAPLPPALQRLVDLLPSPAQLSQPESLRQQVQQSGLWMEAMLGLAARGQGPAHPLAVDLKAQLLRAADQLRQGSESRPAAAPPAPATPANAPALPALTGLLEGLLKRVTSLQLQSLQSFASDEPGNSRWFFELPLRSEQAVHGVFGEIQRESPTDEEPDPPWSIVLTLDIGDLGPMRVAAGARTAGVNVHFTASEPETVARLRQELPRLRERLDERELTVTGLSVRQGEVDPEPRPPGTHRMLDEQA
nr:flagellar hook-length control protein FliK [Thioalkalivibrio sp. ALE16]